MDSVEQDLEILESAIRDFIQDMKRPQNWEHIKKAAGVDIDRPSAVILKSLLNAPAHCHVQELASQLGIEAPFITRKTQDLERAGYITRRQDKLDRRAVDLHVTPKGRSLSNKLWKAQRDIVAEALQHWEPSERHELVTLFKRFSDDLKAVSRKSTDISNKYHNHSKHQGRMAHA